MLVDTSVWAWLGVLAMGAGTILPLWAWFSRSSETGESHAVYYLTLAGVTGVAALAYFAMALDVGTVSVSAGDLEVVRYVDWLVTTPLLILYLGLLARPSRRVLVGLIGVDVVIIAGGIVAAATTGTVSWVAFGVAGVAYLGLVYGLLVSLPRSASAARGPDPRRLRYAPEHHGGVVDAVPGRVAARAHRVRPADADDGDARVRLPRYRLEGRLRRRRGYGRGRAQPPR